MPKASSYLEGHFLQEHKDMTVEQLERRFETWKNFAAKEQEQEIEIIKEPEPKNYDIRKELLESYPILEGEEIEQDILWLEENKLDISLFKYNVHPNTLNAIIAPTHAGKTFFLVNLAFELANKGRVLYISTEQTVREIRRIFHDMYKTNKNSSLMSFAVENPKNIRIEYMKSGTVAAITKQFQSIAQKKDYDFLIIDYITADLVHDARGEYTAASELAAKINEVFIIEHPTTVFTALQANTEGQKAGRHAIRNAALSIGQYMREGSKALDLFHSICFLGMVGIDDEKNNPGRVKQRYITTCKARFNPSEVIGEQYYVKFDPSTSLISLDGLEINTKAVGVKNRGGRED